MDQARYEKGLKRLQQMNNNSSIGSRLMEVSPDLNGYIKEFAFGDVHSREGLSPRDHELVIISGVEPVCGMDIIFRIRCAAYVTERICSGILDLFQIHPS